MHSLVQYGMILSACPFAVASEYPLFHRGRKSVSFEISNTQN